MIVFRNSTLLIIILLLFFTGCAKQHQDKETDDYKKFRQEMDIHCNSWTSETEKVAFLKKCSYNNVYCKSMLGNIYYRIKQYDKAYELLIESQGDLKGFNGHHWAPSEIALGEMYAFGSGVRENREEAKKHFTNCALAGNEQCASWMVSYAKAELKNAQQETAYHSPDYIDYAARELLYWYTVGGYIMVTGSGDGYAVFFTKKGEISNISDEINELKKQIINKKTASEWLNSAEKLKGSFDVLDNFTRNLTYPYCNNEQII